MGFANVSRHPVDVWPREQILAAAKIGGAIQDYEFPTIPATQDSGSVWRWMTMYAKQIKLDGHKHAMVMGEYAATMALSVQLSNLDIEVYVACFDNGHTVEERGEQRLRTRPFIRFRKVTDYLRRDRQRA